MHTGSLLLTLSFLLVLLTLLLGYPELLHPKNTLAPVKHNVVHRIETTGPPTSARTHRLAPDRLKGSSHRVGAHARTGDYTTLFKLLVFCLTFSSKTNTV